MNAKVHWIAENHVYLVTPEPLAVGDLVAFVLDGRQIAEGEVANAHENDLTMVVLTSGRLPSEESSDRIRVHAKRMSVRLPSTLRVGGPSSARSCLLFRAHVTIHSMYSDSSYRVDSLSPRLYREIRAFGYCDPETIMIRLFDDSVDEEIALERGELDVAMFWPGEMSADMRRHPEWTLTREERAYVVATPLGPDWPTPLTPEWFIGVDRDVFRGDLLVPSGTLADSSTVRPAARLGVQIDLDPACPGKFIIERYLNRGLARKRGVESSVRLFCVQAPDILSQVARYLQRTTMPPAARARGDSFAHAIASWNWMQPSAPDVASALVTRVFGINDVLLFRSRGLQPVPYMSRVVDRMFDYRVAPEVLSLIKQPQLPDSLFH